MYFVFCRLYPFNPQPPRQCLGTTCVISLLLNNTVSPDAGLPNHMLGEVSWEPQKKTIVGLLVFQSFLSASQGPNISAFRGWIQRKTWCMVPYTEVDYKTSSLYVQSCVDSKTFRMEYPMPESTLTLCQSRLYPPVRDFWILPQLVVRAAASVHCKKRLSIFPVPRRGVTDQTLPGRE